MTTPAGIAVIDCETTGLDPAVHVPWELAVRVWTPDGWATPVTWTWPLTELELAAADPAALDVGGWYERGELDDRADAIRARVGIAREIVAATRGMQLAGSNPAYDARMVGDWCRRHLHEADRPPWWHYRHLDVVDLAAHHRGLSWPWTSREVRDAFPMPRSYDLHTAAGDVAWCVDLLDALGILQRASDQAAVDVLADQPADAEVVA